MLVWLSLLLQLFTLVTLTCASSGSSQASTPGVIAFHPASFPKNTARCKATNRKENTTKDIEIRYVEINPHAERTIIMVHGWPGLWTNWAHQIRELQNDYHIIAPDHRGFGTSSHPGDVESSGTMADLVGDLVCVLEDANVDSAICLGHDWGAQVCWEAARMRPEAIEAVAAAVVPYLHAAGPFTPTSALVEQLPRLAYQLYFQDKTDAAVKELDKDVRRTLRAVYRSVDSPPPEKFLTSTECFLEDYGDEIEPIPFMTDEEEDYLVQQYSIQGFKNTLQFYTYGNRYAAWKFAHFQGNYTLPQPALAIYPTLDPVADWKTVEKLLHSDQFIPNLTVETLPAAHWVQLEKPVEFNAILRKWLSTLPPRPPREKKWRGERKHLSDEL